MCFSCLWHLMPTDPILQYSVLNGALIIVAMTAIIIIITVLSIFGHICIMYSIFYIKKNVKGWRPGNYGENIIETDQRLILLASPWRFLQTPQVLKKRMVAKFDASGASTVPFQQCIDEEIRILGRRVVRGAIKKPFSSTGRGWSTIYYWGRVVLFLGTCSTHLFP